MTTTEKFDAAPQTGSGVGRIKDASARRAGLTALLAVAGIASLTLAVYAPPFASYPARSPGLHTGAVPVHAAVGAGAGSQARRPATIVTPLSCEKLPNVPGKSVTTALVEFPPGAYSPRHRHPGSVMAYVLKGRMRSQLAGEPVGTYGVGQTWFEPPGAIHLFAENASATEPAELLAIFVADDDCGPLTIPD